jgi:putative endonuclease
MSTDRQRLGKWGESVAALQLEDKGYQILDRNWRCAQGEIDLVALDGEEVVFVEVKTRRGRQMGSPEEGLTQQKGKRLIELARLYLVERDIDPDWRIDLVAVELDNSGKLTRCEHIANAVLGW